MKIQFWTITLILLNNLILAINSNQIRISKSVINCNEPPIIPNLELPEELKLSPLKLCSKYKLTLQLELQEEETEEEEDEPSDGTLLLIDHATVIAEEGEPQISEGLVYFNSKIAIKIQQGPLFLLYPLHYLFTANGKPYEQIYNVKNLPNFTGCKQFEKDSAAICGYEPNETEDIQLKLGYCCPEAQYKDESIHCFKYSDVWFGVHELKQPQVFHQVYLELFRTAEDISTAAAETEAASNEETGGGSGEEGVAWIPLMGPIYIDTIGLSVYEEFFNATNEQIKITYQQKPLPAAGTAMNVKTGPKPKTARSFNQASYLKPESQLLLMPLPKTKSLLIFPNITEEEIDEEDPILSLGNNVEDSFIIIPKFQADDSGTTCNKVGINAHGFIKQPDRCSMTSSSSSSSAGDNCFKHQPLDLLKHKKNLVASFGPIHSPSPIKVIDERLYLVMDWERSTQRQQQHQRIPTVSLIIELTLDPLQFEPIQPNYNGMIYSIIIDSTKTEAKIKITIMNNDKSPASYPIQIYNCNPENSVVLNKKSKKKFRKKLIAGLQMEKYEFILKYGNGNGKNGKEEEEVELMDKVTCTIGLLNTKNEINALRRNVLISPDQTCICYYNCRCKCLNSFTNNNESAGYEEVNEDFTCTKLSSNELIATGFNYKQFMTAKNETDDEETLMSAAVEPLMQEATLHPILTVLFFICILLYLGLCKALIGFCCCKSVLKFGLCYFYNQPKRLTKYYEKQYSRLNVIHDGLGYPLDPITNLPTVQRLGWKQQFCYNLIFFIIWPFLLFQWCYMYCLMGLSTGRRNRNGGRNDQYGRISTEDMLMTDLNDEDAEDGDDDDGNNGGATGEGNIEESDEDIVHFDRTNNSRTTSEEFRSYAAARGSIDDEEFKQYGSDYFLERNEPGSSTIGLGRLTLGASGGANNRPSRKDSNLSGINIKENQSSIYQYRKNAATGKLEYRLGNNFSNIHSRLNPGYNSKAVPVDNNNNTDNSDDLTGGVSSVKSKYGSWHRTPSDWSMSGTLISDVNSRQQQQQVRNDRKDWVQLTEVDLNLK